MNSSDQPAADGSPLDKSAARALARERWADFLARSESRRALVGHLAALIDDWAGRAPGGRMLAFMPQADEIDHRPAWQGFAGEVYLPVVAPSGHGMSFRLYRAGGAVVTELAASRFGLRQPTGGRKLSGAIGPDDLVLVPGLAANSEGARLGRGGGFYDRRGAELAAAECVGLMPVTLAQLDFQAETHDLRLNRVVTEAGLVDYLSIDRPDFPNESRGSQ